MSLELLHHDEYMCGDNIHMRATKNWLEIMNLLEILPNKFVGHRDKYLPLAQSSPISIGLM